MRYAIEMLYNVIMFVIEEFILEGNWSMELQRLGIMCKLSTGHMITSCQPTLLIAHLPMHNPWLLIGH